jgi:DNA-binding protein
MSEAVVVSVTENGRTRNYVDYVSRELSSEDCKACITLQARGRAITKLVQVVELSKQLATKSRGGTATIQQTVSVRKSDRGSEMTVTLRWT